MANFSGKHSFLGVKSGGVRTFLIGFFFNRGGGRVLGLNRKGLMIWLMVVKIVGFKLPSHYLH